MPTPLELINRRRRQLHVHSVLYYHMDSSIITDAQFDAWSAELIELHAQYPKLVMQGYEPALFADWTGATGMHLPVNAYTANMAVWLRKKYSQRGGRL